MNKSTVSNLIAIFLGTIIFAGCGGGSSNTKDNESSDSSETKDNFQIITYGDIYTGEGFKIYDSEATQISALHGTVIKSSDEDNTWSYTPNTDYIDELSSADRTQVEEEFTITTNEKTEKKVVKLAVNETGELISDPFLDHEWHLVNKGQNPFETTLDPVVGIDLNVKGAWRQLDSENRHITGKGIKVAIYDSPVDFEHPDLKDRKYPIIQDTKGITTLNTIFNQNIGELNNSEVLHGTMVAGIIAGSRNNAGVRGIAFDAQLLSFSTDIDDDNNNDDDGEDYYDESNYKVPQEILDTYAIISDKKNIDVINESIGAIMLSYEYPELTSYLMTAAKNGIPLVKAMGNEFDAPIDSKKCPGIIKLCVNYGTDCEFKQTRSDDRFPFNINVGSLNSLGKRSSYSSTGPSLWITGFGGEYGYLTNEDNSSPTIVTTLYHDKLLSSIDPDYNDPWRNKIDPSGKYTAKMNATSAATPTVTGVIALMLQANPNLSLPQIRYILAKTARNDTALPSTSYDKNLIKNPFDSTNMTLVDDGWKNIGTDQKLRFSSYYGFGVVDASAAVESALKCNNDEVCNGYKEFPSEYKSNETKCEAVNGDKRKVVCNITSFVDNSGVAINNVLVDALTFNFKGFEYKKIEEGDVDNLKAIYANIDENVDNEDYIAPSCSDLINDPKNSVTAFKVNAGLEILLEVDGTLSIIKPILSNWINTKSFENDLFFNTNVYYRSHISNNSKAILTVNALCPIDINLLEQYLTVKFYGYENK